MRASRRTSLELIVQPVRAGRGVHGGRCSWCASCMRYSRGVPKWEDMYGMSVGESGHLGGGSMSSARSGSCGGQGVASLVTVAVEEEGGGRTVDVRS